MKKKEFNKILPFTSTPADLPVSYNLPTPDGKIAGPTTTLSELFKDLKREWCDGLIIKKSDAKQFKKLTKEDGEHDFKAQDFLQQLQEFYSKIMICKIDDDIGWGVFVRPGQVLKKGSRLFYGGVLDFNESVHATNSHAFKTNLGLANCTALIDPIRYGGICDLINHGFLKEQLEQYFKFDEADMIKKVATANLQMVTICHYKGLQMPGYEVIEDIAGGQQLFGNYLSPYEFQPDFSVKKAIRLFGQRGHVIPSNQYRLKYLQIVIDNSKHKAPRCYVNSLWAIEYKLHHENDYLLLFVGATDYKIPSKLIRSELKKNPNTALMLLNSDSKTSSTRGVILVNQVQESHSKNNAIRLWLNTMFPVREGDHFWETYRHPQYKDTVALIKVHESQVEVYLAHLEKVLNIKKEKLFQIEIENAWTQVGFEVEKWWSLCELPQSPFPASLRPLSGGKDWINLSITTTAKPSQSVPKKHPEKSPVTKPSPSHF